MNLLESPLAVVGLGYVGLPLAVEFGKQRPVLGFDINAARVAELQGGHDHTLECSAQELRAAAQLRFSHDPADLKTCQVFIVTVPTPVDAPTGPT
jgi:UDP-N-acetyl-D-galactosamine dehydrogenase